MERQPLSHKTDEIILGVEGGGTKTAWALVAGDAILDSGKLPPSNLRLTAPNELRDIFRALPARAHRAGVFLAGCATEEDRNALRNLAREIWPNAQIVVGSDRESGMAACLREADGIVVNAGTGSSVTGRRGSQIERAGGWGHILGDTGGAYFVSIRALRVILRDYDLRRENRQLSAKILLALLLNNFDELVRWAQTADKTQIASLAPIVFGAAAEGDQAPQRLIHAGAVALANFAAAVASRLEMDSPQVRLMGGLFEHQPSYVEAFETSLREKLPKAQIALATTPPELGAVRLAARGDLPSLAHIPQPESEFLLTTEEANPNSVRLAKLSARELVELFVEEEKSVEAALGERIPQLARAIEMAGDKLAKGGRIFYAGAGTSGRLGVLDAAEMTPTFGMPPDRFQAIIAGGAAAIQRSVEGAEDDAAAGASSISAREIGANDLVIGISASGRAPFVIGALERARERGASVILLTCNPTLPSAPMVDLIIDLPTGPEILAGSTRLKAGTATKVALNIVSTGAMVRLGRVHENLMIDLRPTNRKLRARAVRLVAKLGGLDEKTARNRLERTGWNVRAALKE